MQTKMNKSEAAFLADFAAHVLANALLNLENPEEKTKYLCKLFNLAEICLNCLQDDKKCLCGDLNGFDR